MLELDQVSVAYGEALALNNVTLSLGPTERLALLGPSGSGKSTLLRSVAGLEPLHSGRITWAGRDLAEVPVHRRRLGLMFQDYVLFPQRDVRGNVCFGLEVRGDARSAIDARVDEVLELVGLSGYGARRVNELSGGEQQRVALARALAPTPLLLMLDEPLGALDRALRSDLLDELAGLFNRLELPIIYVTHDREEALAIADRVAVMRAGRLEALLPPDELWRSPPNEFAARFLGLGDVIPYSGAGSTARTPWGEVPLPAGAPETGRLLLRADGLVPDPAGSLSGTVRTATFRGDHVRVLLDAPDVAPGAVAAADQPPLEAELRGANVRVGERLTLAVTPGSVLVFAPRETDD